MKFDDPNSEQLDFDANLRKKGATLHSWAMEYLALEDKKVKQTKSYKSKIAAIRKLAKKKATRAEANIQIRTQHGVRPYLWEGVTKFAEKMRI